MAELPHMPLWVDRYIGDTDHLTYEENGIYLKLLMVMWITPDRRLPNDDIWLSRRFRLPPEKLRPIIKEFCQCDGNWITQKGLQKVWSEVQAKRRQASDAAKSRWDKEKDPFGCIAEPHSDRNASKAKAKAKTKEEERKKVSSQNCVLPNTWEPSERHFKTGEKRGLTRQQVNDMAFDMREWSLANGKKKADWNIFFNIWMKNNYGAPNGNGRRNGPAQGNGGGKSAILDTLDRAIEARRTDRLRAIEGPGNDGLFPEGGSERPGEVSAGAGGNIIGFPKAGD